ncbi:unknown [Prevotella sp. CAG:1185]|nr:unknown [Prevotella sp. CAG:1185]
MGFTIPLKFGKAYFLFNKRLDLLIAFVKAYSISLIQKTTIFRNDKLMRFYYSEPNIPTHNP